MAVIIGELLGRYLNDWIQNWSIKRNKGIFEAEARLWYVPPCLLCLWIDSHVTRALYLSVILNVVGYVVLGAAIEKHLSLAALIMGWGIGQYMNRYFGVAVSLFHSPGLNNDWDCRRVRVLQRCIPKAPGTLPLYRLRPAMI